MNLNQRPADQAKASDEHTDPVLLDLWRMKDARATKFRNAAGLMKHLQKKYKTITQS